MNMEKHVIIYTLPACPFCVQAKEHLRSKGFEYNEKDVGEDHEAREEMIDLSGQQGVPVISINDEVVVGYNQTMLDTLLTDN